MLKLLNIMKLGLKSPSKFFKLSLFLILMVSLVFLGWVYYEDNILYPSLSSPFAKGPLTLPPKTLRLDLEQPAEDSLFFTPEIMVAGKTSPFMDVLISTPSRDLVVKSAADGSFNSSLSLDEGANNITVVVFDASGESRSVDRTIFYSKEKI